MSTEQWKKDNIEKMRLYRREWYYKNREREIKKTYTKKRLRERNLRIWLLELKEKLSCKTCGESSPECLDFHHNDPRLKKFNIANATSRGFSKENILIEIKKCTVLCANCHRKLHACGSSTVRAVISKIKG